MNELKIILMKKELDCKNVSELLFMFSMNSSCLHVFFIQKGVTKEIAFRWHLRRLFFRRIMNYSAKVIINSTLGNLSKTVYL